MKDILNIPGWFCSLFLLLLFQQTSYGQCPEFSNFVVNGNTGTLCEGASITITHSGSDIPAGSSVDWYLGEGTGFNPYEGEGELIGSVPVSSDPCNNIPEILYIMVNPDNIQVGGTGDQCDEFIVMWTGSGGYSVNDILVSNLGPGTFQWDNFAAGNGSTFSCGTPLAPGPVPENAILIIQSYNVNNVVINSDELCNSGLPVYIITYTGPTDCTGGYFDNNSPCSSCPVNVDIDGATCDFSFSLDYAPPASSIDGWAWANTGSGVYADVIPALDIPGFEPPSVDIPPFTWTIPDDFCEDMGEGDWNMVGILDPPPTAGCPEIFSPYIALDISCPQMMLSGGGDVCAGNCPDNPTIISMEIVGDDVPFIVDFIVTASVFPPFPINGLEVTNGQTIAVCLEGFFPSFDPGSGILTVPELAIGISATIEVVSAVSASGCPVDVGPSSITLNFIEAPTADAGDDDWVCDNGTITLEGSIGGSATDVIWTTSGDGSFDDPTDLFAEYTPDPADIDNGEVTLTLTATDENGACTPAVSTIVVEVLPSWTIDVGPPQTVCNTDVVIVNAVVTGPPASGYWNSNGDGEFDNPFAESTIYTPGAWDISQGMIVLHYGMNNSGPCTAPDVPLFITFVPAPEVDIPDNLEICEDENIIVTINVEGNYTDVSWTAGGDGTLVVLSEFEVDYTPGPQDINNQFFILSVTVVSGFAECGQTTYNIPVNIIFCDCPPFETQPPSDPLCAENGQLDLNTLIVDSDAGDWSITNVPPGSNPATLTGDMFIADNSDPGVYTVTYTLTNPEPGCPPTSSEMILVSAPVVPFAGPDITLCGVESVAITGSITPAGGAPVLWTTSGDGTFTNPNNVNTMYQPGPLDSLSPGVFLVLLSQDAVCGFQDDSLTVFFNQQPIVNFVNDTVVICNEEDKGSVLDFDDLILEGDTTGTWTNLSGVPVDMNDPDSVNFNGITSGFYAFQYQTTSAVAPCTDITETIIVQVMTCACPLLVVQNPPEGVCNDLPSLPLNAFIMAGAPGAWQVVSTPPGSNPATIAGSDMIINGCDPGVYRVRFTFDSAPIEGCPDSTEFDVIVQEIPGVAVSGDTVSCGADVIDVTGTLFGSATGVFWSTTGFGLFSDPTLLNTVFQPITADVVVGSVLLIATSIDTQGLCPVANDTLQVDLFVPPFAILNALSDTICNAASAGSIINFSSYIIGGDANGLWTDTDGSMVNLANPASVDFNGVIPGSYRFTYTTQSAIAPCMDASYEIVIIVEQCLCPSLDIVTDPLQLCESSVIDLELLIIDASEGDWSITDGPSGGMWPQVIGSELSTFDAVEGDYHLTYTLVDSVPGCPASVTLPLYVEEEPAILVQEIGCDSLQLYYAVSIQTDAVTLTANEGIVVSEGPGIFSVDSIPTGQDLSLTAVSASGLCIRGFDITAPDCNCTLFIEDISDTIRFCPGDTFVLIPYVTGAIGLPFSTWVLPDGSTKMWPSLDLYKEGEYIWIVMDMGGCEERDTFYAEFLGPERIIASTIPPSCPDNLDGTVIIEQIVEGTPPFAYQLDQGLSNTIGQLPFVITNVGAGIHLLSITDNTNCTLDTLLTVESPDDGMIELGPDRVVEKGDSILIEAEVNNLVVSLVTWNPSMPGQDLEPFWLQPDSSMTLSVEVVDTAGCTHQDTLLIRVVESERFFIPNLFSPNGDQINDVIEVHTNLLASQLLSFEIFDRWGNMLYAQYEQTPYNWDGNSKGKVVQSGVYVYKLTWQDTSGEQNIKTGNITVLR